LVEVVGFASLGAFSPTMQRCEAQALGPGPLPAPRGATFEEARTGRLNMQLIQIQGRLAPERLRAGKMLVLNSGTADEAFTADLEAFDRLEPFAHLQPGSVLELTGVCSMRKDASRKPASFNLLIRSPADIVVLKPPPWWTPAHTFRVLGFSTLTLALALGWVWSLQRQVRRQTEQIRQRLEKEAALERQYCELVENANDIIYTHDLEGKFTSFNRAGERLLGYSREEILQHNFSRIVAPEQLDLARSMVSRKLHGSGPTTYQLDLVAKDGRRIAFEVSSWLRHQAGGVDEVQGIARDITERQHAEAAIRKLNDELERRVAQRTAELTAVNKELEAFSHSVSHDLRAPLRHISGFASIVAEHPAVSAQADLQKPLSRIMAATSRMGRLIDDLLRFSRMARVPLARQPVAFDELVADVLRELQSETAGRDIQWKIAPLPEVRGDPATLRLVWQNLLGNALKYTRLRPRALVEVGGQPSEREWTFYVRDNGAGFDLRYADRLFGVFQRLHRDDEFEGTGIGLANVRRIVQRHGGRTWAEGAVDQGATFYFTLPR
jgi:PAS domain S-box-containing protein